MNETTKKCPLCAEQIPVDATICEYCSARFEVVLTGYCGNCHQVREADEKGRCRTCGGEVLDQHIESRLLTDKAQRKPIMPVEAPPVSASRTRSASPPKKRSAVGCVIGILIVMAGISIVGTILLRSGPKLTPSLALPTRTSTPTQTPTPTPTHRPTRTATPLPLEITFDTLEDYPVGQQVILHGQLVMFGGTYCDTDCGMLLANPTKTSQKITIFVTLGESRENTLPNQMRPLPDPYTKKDIQVRLDDGTYAGIGSRIIVTGSICETTDGDVCIHDILKIEVWK